MDGPNQSSNFDLEGGHSGAQQSADGKRMALQGGNLQNSDRSQVEQSEASTTESLKGEGAVTAQEKPSEKGDQQVSVTSSQGVSTIQQMAALQLARNSGSPTASHKWAHLAGAPIPANASSPESARAGWTSLKYAALATPPIPAGKRPSSQSNAPVTVSKPAEISGTEGDLSQGGLQNNVSNTLKGNESARNANANSKAIDASEAEQQNISNANVPSSQGGGAKSSSESSFALKDISVEQNPPHTKSDAQKEESGKSEEYTTRMLASSQELKVPRIAKGQRILWTPVDDALLRKAVESGLDFSVIAAEMPFTSPFSVRDLETRWFSMLYDPMIAMEVASEYAVIQGNAPAAKLPSSQGGKFGLRRRDSAEEGFGGGRAMICSASDALIQGVTPSLAKDSGITALVEAVDSSEAEPVNPLAAIDGAELHCLVYKTKISIGRNCSETSPQDASDIDLGVEGDAKGVSRRQAYIRKDSKGWWLDNVGRGSVYINGSSVPKGGSSELPGRCLLVIGGLKLVFERENA
uniref:FHA domain-containing protein n=1 Tax=Guillardia theta TaxID=55529 RepID=A0A7S4US96_GUITH